MKVLLVFSLTLVTSWTSTTPYFFALRCLGSEGCFPFSKCKEQVQVLPDSFEAKAFCGEKIPRDGTCVIYSVGINQDISLETKLAKDFNCEVHAFDPTTRVSSTSSVTVHKYGLMTHATSNSLMYDPISSTDLKPLHKIMHHLNHTKLTMLLLDCEGCEWQVLHRIMCHSKIQIDQISVEFHYQKGLGLSEATHARNANHLLECMAELGWELGFFRNSGVSPVDAVYTPGIVKILHHFLQLHQATFHRPVRPSWTVITDGLKEHLESKMKKFKKDWEELMKYNANEIDAAQLQSVLKKWKAAETNLRAQEKEFSNSTVF